MDKNIPQNNLNNRTFSLDQDEITQRLEDKDDSDYWSTPSSSMRYYRSMKYIFFGIFNDRFKIKLFYSNFYTET